MDWRKLLSAILQAKIVIDIVAFNLILMLLISIYIIQTLVPLNFLYVFLTLPAIVFFAFLILVSLNYLRSLRKSETGLS
jgi:hypothetical protein